jgi:hypothetical protein
MRDLILMRRSLLRPTKEGFEGGRRSEREEVVRGRRERRSNSH